MSDQEENKHFWDIKDENGLLTLLDPGKRFHVYVKWDGSVHVWFYDNDSRIPFDHDTGLVDYSSLGINTKANHDYYWHIGDIDEEIARLQAIRAIATKWFDEHKNQQWPPNWDAFPDWSLRDNEPAWNDVSRNKSL